MLIDWEDDCLKVHQFVNDLRLHSKTVFKVPAAVLVTLLALVVVTISNYRCVPAVTASGYSSY